MSLFKKKDKGFFAEADKPSVFLFGLLSTLVVIAIVGSIVLLTAASKPMDLSADIGNEAEKVENKSQPAPEELPKTDKPVVELFVMSHCPYGTQIEKGILPVIDTLGDKIDYELKFCDYAMHGKTELDEQLTQYCVQRQGKDKIQAYLSCFLEDESKSEECLGEIGIDRGQLDSCIAQTDEEYSVSADFEDKSTWSNGRFPLFKVYQEDNDKYGVGGSPTLIVNGVKASSGRDSASLLATICGAFNSPPEECNAELSSEAPAPGFGFDGSGSNTNASCN